VVSALVLCAPALLLNAWDASLDAETRFSPLLFILRETAVLLPALSLFVVLRVVRRSWAAVKSLSVPRRAGWLAAVFVVQVALAVAGMAAGVLTQENWLFGPSKPYASVRSPDGKRTAHATRDCFLRCDLEIHIQEGAQPTMRRVHRFTGVDASEAQIVWLADSSDVEVRNLKPEAEKESTLPYLGPH
jgi:hypothetical protein